MFRLIVAGFLVSLSLVAQDCNIDLGDLDQYVITYQVSLKNGGGEDISAVIKLADVVQSMTMRPGATVTVKGFKAGTWGIVVSSAELLRAQLENRQSDLSRRLNDPKLSAAAARALATELQSVSNELAEVRSRQSDGGSCGGSLSVQTSQTAKRTAVQTNGLWTC